MTPTPECASSVAGSGSVARFRALSVLLAVMASVTGLAVVGSGARPVAAQVEMRTITLPVHPDFVDQVSWSDTWGAPRSGGRQHEGVDIMGPKMVPLVAAVDGEVTWLRHDAERGNNLEITDADGWMYHYVHINNDTPGTDDGANAYEFAFAPGIEQGAKVRAGQIVAFLGDSGNAESTGAHLHFEIERPDGSNINPTASVDAALVRMRSTPTLDDLGPYGSASELFDDVFTTLTGRPATAENMQALADVINRDGLSAALSPYIDQGSQAADIQRLYVAFFLRLPDLGGYRYWIERKATDLDLVRIADNFAGSPEYQARYGSLPFGSFLDQLYLDVLGRQPDEAGKAYWLARLDDPNDVVTKGTIVAFFTDSPELRSLAAHRSEIVALTALFEDRMPTDAETAEWEVLRRSRTLVESIDAYLAALTG